MARHTTRKADTVESELEKIKLREEAQKRIDADKQMEAEMHSSGRNVDRYRVSGVDMESGSDKAMALRELAIMQRGIITDYAEMAKVDVKYADLAEPGSREREMQLMNKLKSHDDAYTMRMFTSCLTPLQQGIDVKSVFSTYMSFKVQNILNPDYKTDMSRLYANMADSIRDVAQGSNNPIIKAAASHFSKVSTDKAVSEERKAIKKGLADNNIDNLYMTPRQIAALKLNFTEQYYTDIRGLDPNAASYGDKKQEHRDNYDKAMEHLTAIANNSGYEMSAVAEEERYLVGLKAQVNPNYHNIFNETVPPYGAMAQAGAAWDGQYSTADGHSYTAPFSPRERYTEQSVSDLGEDITRRGQQYAWMQQYLASDACTASKDAKKEALKIVSQQFNAYRDAVAIQLQDDLGYSEAQSHQFFDDKFKTAVKAEKAISKEDAFSQTNVFGINSPALQGMDFYRELRYVTEKAYIQETTGINISAGKTEHPTPAQEKIEKESGKADRSRTDLDIRQEALRAIDTSADADVTGKRVSDMYVKRMDGEELAKLMLHVGCNMEQGWQRNEKMGQSTYSRHMEPSCLEGSTFTQNRESFALNMTENHTNAVAREGYDIGSTGDTVDFGPDM